MDEIKFWKLKFFVSLKFPIWGCYVVGCDLPKYPFGVYTFHLYH